MLSTREFAEKMSVNYRTALKWLQSGIVPGATEQKLPNGIIFWDIPATALMMERPKKGPKPAKNGLKK